MKRATQSLRRQPRRESAAAAVSFWSRSCWRSASRHSEWASGEHGPGRRIRASMVAASSTRDARRHGARPDGFREKGGLDLASRPPVANAADLFLLLALGVRLRGVLVRRLGFFGSLSGLLFCTRMIVAAVLLGRRPMRLCGLIVKFGSLLVRVLRHRVSLLFGEAQTNVSRSRSFQRVEPRKLGTSARVGETTTSIGEARVRDERFHCLICHGVQCFS
jgi:hypothetical protein